MELSLVSSVAMSSLPLVARLLPSLRVLTVKREAGRLSTTLIASDHY